MNMRQGKRKYISSFVAASLAILLVTGLTGISVHVHYCHGNRSSVHFFPELISENSTCKCETEETDQCHTAGKDAHSIKQKPCCTDLRYFKKLVLDTNIQFSASSTKDIYTLPVKLLPVQVQNHAALYKICTRPPPDRHCTSGKNRIVFLHQFRFSAISGDC